MSKPDPYADLEHYISDLADKMATLKTEDADYHEDMESIASSAAAEENKRLLAEIRKLEEGDVKKTPKKKSDMTIISDVLGPHVKYNGVQWFDCYDHQLFMLGAKEYMDREDINVEKLADPEVTKLVMQILHPLKVYKTVRGVQVPVYKSYHEKWSPAILEALDILGCKDVHDTYKQSLQSL